MPGVLKLPEAAAISSQDVPSQAASFQPDSMQATQQADTAPLVSPSGTQRAAQALLLQRPIVLIRGPTMLQSLSL